MNLDVPIKQRLLGKAARAGIPVLGTFELTPRCNFQCKMCYVRMTEAEMRPLGRELTAEEWLALGRTAFDAGMVFLLITGGEPLLRPDFPQIYEGLAKLGLSISLNTNGTLIRGGIRELFQRFPPAHINITLYGTSRETYGALCGNPDGFDRVVDALHWLKDNGILVNLNATLTPWNFREFHRIEEFAKQEGLNFRPAIYNFPPARRSNAPAYQRLTPEQAGALFARRELQRKDIKDVSAFLATMQGLPQHECVAEGEPLHCYAGRSQFWVTWNGEMTACGMLDTPKTNLKEKGFCPAWDELRAETAKIRLCAECSACKKRNLCAGCAAVNYTETGNFDGKPEYMCRMIDAFLDELRKGTEA